MVKQATESFRRMRPLNPRLAGLMPFTILFYNWSGIASFDQMKPKPAMEQLGFSYQPVLLSWEMWTPQVYAGTKLRAIAHVINDAEDGAALTNATLVYRLQARDGRRSCQGTIELPAIPYFGTWSQALELDLPADLPTGEYLLSGNILAGARTLSTNSAEVFIAGASWRQQTRRPEALVHFYDPAGKTAAALKQAGIKFKHLAASSPWPAQMSALVIGEGAWDKALAGQKPQLQRFVREGGRILCLRPDSEAFDAIGCRSQSSCSTAPPTKLITRHAPGPLPSR